MGVYTLTQIIVSLCWAVIMDRIKFQKLLRLILQLAATAMFCIQAEIAIRKFIENLILFGIGVPL